MQYEKPNNAPIIYIDKDHRIEAGEHAWIFSKRYPSGKGSNRFHFQMNANSLESLLFMVREHFIKRSDKNDLSDALDETNKLIETSMKSHEAFLKEYLH